MGTCTLEPHTIHKYSLPPRSLLDKKTIKGTPSHCGNCISLCGLHVPRTELGQQCRSGCVNMDHNGQDPVLTHPSEQVSAFVSQLKGLPPCLHPTCLSPSVHPSTSGGFLRSLGQLIYLLERACRAMMQGPVKARPCLAFREALRGSNVLNCVLLDDRTFLADC